MHHSKQSSLAYTVTRIKCKMNKTSIFYFIFWVICFSMTIHRLMACWNKYVTDESFSNTEYVDLLSPGSPYPALSICLKNPYLNEELPHTSQFQTWTVKSASVKKSCVEQLQLVLCNNAWGTSGFYTQTVATYEE